MFTTILPTDKSNIDLKTQNNIKTVSIQDQTFRRKFTDKLDKSNINQSKPAKNGEQDFIIPRTIQQGYYDKEHTLVVYGLDRNWTDRHENRYNFNLRFQDRNTNETNAQSLGTAKVSETFRNIIGIQLVNVILPNEPINTITELNDRNTTTTSRLLNVLQYPYINVDVESINGELQGTNNNIKQSFGNLRYDKDIRSDSTNKSSGYFSFLSTDPSQKRLFYPTPLSNLKHMNISIRNPLGNILLEDKDCIEVEKLFIANTDISSQCPGGSTLADLSNSIPYINTNVLPTSVGDINYMIIKTGTYFRAGHIQIGDIIRFNDIVVP